MRGSARLRALTEGITQSGRINRSAAMQFKVRSMSAMGAAASGVDSPGIKGLTLQPARGNCAARMKLASKSFSPWFGNPAMKPELTLQPLAAS